MRERQRLKSEQGQQQVVRSRVRCKDREAAEQPKDSKNLAVQTASLGNMKPYIGKWIQSGATGTRPFPCEAPFLDNLLCLLS